MQTQAADATRGIFLFLRSRPFRAAMRTSPVQKLVFQAQSVAKFQEHEEHPGSCDHPNVSFRENDAAKRDRENEHFHQTAHPRGCIPIAPRFKLIELGPRIRVDEMRGGERRDWLALESKNVHPDTSRLFHRLYPSAAHASRCIDNGREDRIASSRGTLGFDRGAEELE